MEVFHTASLSERDFVHIVSALNAGGVIGFPTDTAYGLGADPFNDQAVREIFTVKGREEAKPILLLVDSIEMLERVAQPTAVFRHLTDEFWPGPLTVILKAQSALPDRVTAGTGTIGVRWPVSAFCKDLLGRFGKPITATSANRSGLPSCLTAVEVREQLEDRLPLLIDGGELPERGGSTIVDCTVDPVVLVRAGPIPFARLSESLDGRILRKKQ